MCLYCVLFSIRFWCQDFEETLSEIIASLLTSKYQNSSPNKRKRPLKNAVAQNTAPTSDQVRLSVVIIITPPYMFISIYHALLFSFTSASITFGAFPTELSTWQWHWHRPLRARRYATGTSTGILAQHRQYKGNIIFILFAYIQCDINPLTIIPRSPQKQYTDLFALAAEDETSAVGRRGGSARGRRPPPNKKDTNSTNNNKKNAEPINNTYSSDEQSSDVSILSTIHVLVYPFTVTHR